MKKTFNVFFSLSMKTQSGYIYCLSNKAFSKNVYKVGFTKNNIDKRAKHLYRTGVPMPFRIEYAKYVRNVENKEKLLHDALDKYRINKNREFFKVDKRIIYELFDDIKGKFSIDK